MPAIKHAISQVEFDAESRLLHVRGWLLGTSPNARLTLETSSGQELGNPVSGLLREDVALNFPEYDDTHSGWELQVEVDYLPSNESVVLIVEDEGKKISSAAPIRTLAPKPGGTRPDTARARSEPPSITEIAEQRLADAIDLLQSSRSAESETRGGVVFFPPFDDQASLTNHYHRARWYLPREVGVLESVTFGTSRSLQAGTRPDFMCEPRQPTSHISILPAADEYWDALSRARAILVWQSISDEDLLRLRKAKPRTAVLPVATDDLVSGEFGNYCKVHWKMMSKDARETVLREHHERFRVIASEIEARGTKSAVVFGTGPSIDSAFDYDFSEHLTIVCNTVITSPALMNHIKPTFVCAGDVVSHFGVSRYAEKFRRELKSVLESTDVYFLTSAQFGNLFRVQFPEVAHKVLLCDQRSRDPVLDLEANWSLPQLDSTLNIHMLPIASTLADTIYILGVDGKNPDPSKNEDFWAHSSLSQYHDLVSTGHQCHPTFDKLRQKATHRRFLDSSEASLSAGERAKKRYFSLRPSFTPAFRRRPVPPHLVTTTENGKTRLDPGRAERPKRSDRKRILLVCRVNPAHFSAGRYHAFMAAEALASVGHDVVVWADHAPNFLGDLTMLPGHERIDLHFKDFATAPKGEFDFVFIVPDSNPGLALYQAALNKARESSARTILLNFEAGNWFNAMAPTPRPIDTWSTWTATAKYCDIVLSSSREGNMFARDFYKDVPEHTLFLYAYPAINDIAANHVSAMALSPEDQIVCISRFGDDAAHKNVQAIESIAGPELKDHTVALIAGTGEFPSDDELEELRSCLEKRGARLKLLYGVSDVDKFVEIAKSKLMVFPSLFEGFGYPPVEALYMGRPCVAFDLPVLREVNGEQLDYVRRGDLNLMREAIARRLRNDGFRDVPNGREKINEVASLSGFATRLEAVLQEASKLTVAPAAIAWTPPAAPVKAPKKPKTTSSIASMISDWAADPDTVREMFLALANEFAHSRKQQASAPGQPWSTNMSDDELAALIVEQLSAREEVLAMVMDRLLALPHLGDAVRARLEGLETRSPTSHGPAAEASHGAEGGPERGQ